MRSLLGIILDNSNTFGEFKDCAEKQGFILNNKAEAIFNEHKGIKA